MTWKGSWLPVEDGREAGGLPGGPPAFLLVGLPLFRGFQNSRGVQLLQRETNADEGWGEARTPHPSSSRHLEGALTGGV